MAEILPWLILLALIVFGIVMIVRQRPMTQEEYDERLGKGNALGNALQEVQELLGPGGAENLRKAKAELREEADPSGDPPEPGDEGTRAGGGGSGGKEAP